MVRVEDRSALVGSAQPQPSKYGTRDWRTIDVFARRNLHFHKRHFHSPGPHSSRPGQREKMFSLYLILAAFVGLLHAKSSTGDSVLVILDNKLNRSDYSLFFGGLERASERELMSRLFNCLSQSKDTASPFVRRGTAHPRSRSMTHQTSSTLSYLHHIQKVRPASVEISSLTDPGTLAFASDITPQSLVSLLEKGTNLLLALSQKQNLVNSLANEFSLILPPPQTPLVSHVPEREEPATVIPITPQPNALVSSDLPPVWFSGTPAALGNNPLLFPILRAPAESFASDATADSGADSVLEAADRGGEGLWAGNSLSLVTGFQTRNGARATWVGGVELFSNSFAEKKTLR